jgi:cell division protein FtsN
MTNYRDPKVTESKKSSMTWVGIAVAVLLVLLLVWMFWPTDEQEEVIAPTQEPAAEVTTPQEEERVIDPSQDPDVDVVPPQDAEPDPAPAE